MAWAERRGRRWRGVYRDAEGKKHYAGVRDTKKEAKQNAERYEHRVTTGDWHDPKAGQILFSEYFEKEWLPNRIIEPTTYTGYKSYYDTELRDTFGHLEVGQITRGHIQRWVIDMRKRGVSAKTIREKYRLLAVVLGGDSGVSAVNDGLIEKTPCTKIELPRIARRRKKVYTTSQVDTLLGRLDEWWQIAVLVLADTGVRFGELQGFEVRDFDGARLTVERTVVELTKARIKELGLGDGTQFYVKEYPKDGEERKIPLSPEVASRLTQVIRDRELFPGDRIFAMHDQKGRLKRTEEWPHGKPVVRSHFRKEWREAHGDDIAMLNVHALRGSMISWLILEGVDIGAVMTRSGHSRLTTVQAYFDQFDDDGQRALAGLQRARAAGREAAQ